MKIADFVKGKKVIIVGPSKNVLADCEGIDVDSYDVIVRVNHHYAKATDEERSITGKRTDMIYHCLHPSLIKKRDVDYWRDNNVKIITRYPWAERNPSQYDHDEFYLIDGSFIDNLKRELHCDPHTGVVALLHLLSLPIGTLTVVGFDFYQTYYFYENKDFQGEPNPSSPPSLLRQFEYVKKAVQENRKFIPIGKLKQMLEAEA